VGKEGGLGERERIGRERERIGEFEGSIGLMRRREEGGEETEA